MDENPKTSFFLNPFFKEVKDTKRFTTLRVNKNVIQFLSKLENSSKKIGIAFWYVIRTHNLLNLLSRLLIIFKYQL